MYKYPELNKLAHIWELEGEVWKDIPSHKNKYQVSNYGRVRRLEHKIKSRNQAVEFFITLADKVLKANNDSRGYPQVTISNPKRVARVHRLVGEVFLEPPNEDVRQECNAAGLSYVLLNHKDFNTENACANNLEWCTPKYNVDYSEEAYSQARKAVSGSKNYQAILSEEDVTKIVEMLEEGLLSQEKIAERFGVKQITISNIWTGRSWSHFTGIPWTPRTRKKKERVPKALVH